MTETARRPLLPFYFAQAFAHGALASVVALLSELRDKFGLGESQLGIIVGIGFLTAFITQLTVSKLADRGHAPLMIRLGLACVSGSLIGFAAASVFWQFVLARAILGVGVGMAQPAARRTVLLSDPTHAGRNLGRLASIEVIGFALAPALAGMLAELGGIVLPFVVLASGVAIAIAGLGRVRPDGGRKSDDNTSSLHLLKNRRFVGNLLLATSTMLVIGAYEATWAVMLTDNGATLWQVGLSFTIFSIPMAVMAPFAGAWAQRGNAALIAIVGLGSAIVLGVGFSWVHTYWVFVALAFVISFGEGAGVTAGLYEFSRSVPDERQASAHGLQGATAVLFAGIASVVAAWLYDTSGQTVVWMVMPAIAFGSLTVGVLLRRT
ncbi:MAG: MFS transporter [Actinomycetia bacterium]|nr:MFS transporter [Actinomycetes bacterium]MCP4961698.1 MFS transporter [Actinomycetes bacterium]